MASKGGLEEVPEGMLHLVFPGNVFNWFLFLFYCRRPSRMISQDARLSDSRLESALRQILFNI